MFSKIVFVSCFVAAIVARPDKLPNNSGFAGYELPQPPQQLYSAPSQPEQSYSPPEQSYSPPEQSYSQPEESYSQPEQSYSAPQPSYVPEEEGMPFNYGYEVKDDYSGVDFGHNTDSDGDFTKGEYRVLLPDGRTQIVSYTSSKDDGYQAEVRYEGEAKFDEPQGDKYLPQPTYQQPDQTYQEPEQTYQQPEQSYQQPEQAYQQPEQAHQQPEHTYGPPRPQHRSQSPFRF